jgi:K+/H+ antiporter YhaU regulatory subunit KhtT
LVDNKPKLSLGIVHSSIGEELGWYKDNQPALICPVEATKEETDVICDVLSKAIKPSKDFSSLSESIQYHSRVIVEIIRALHPKYPSISSY